MFRCIGPWLHRWSRPFWDADAKINYNLCLSCGRRERSPQQYGGNTVATCTNRECPVGCPDDHCLPYGEDM